VNVAPTSLNGMLNDAAIGIINTAVVCGATSLGLKSRHRKNQYIKVFLHVVAFHADLLFLIYSPLSYCTQFNRIVVVKR
jgi:hypothetical protein